MTVTIGRRELLAALGGAAAAWPFAARAQQSAGIRRVGMLINLSETDLEAQRLVTAFREGPHNWGGSMAAIFG
jgi:putative ABC transport system substrate-binding protein